LMFAAAFAVALKPFAGAVPARLKDVREGSAMLWLGPLALGLAGLALALLPAFYHANLSSPMASAVSGSRLELDISAWPHLGLPLLLSLLTIGLGYLVCRNLGRVRDAVASVLQVIGWGPDRGFDQAMSGLIRFSFGLTGLLHGGELKRYLSVTFIAIAAAILLPMILLSE